METQLLIMLSSTRGRGTPTPYEWAIPCISSDTCILREALSKIWQCVAPKISCFSHGVWARTREKTVVSEFKRFRNGVNGYRGLIVSVAIVPVSKYSCYFDGYYFLSNQSEVPRHMKPSISATGLYQVFSKMTLIISLPMRVASGNRGSKYFEMRSKRSW